MPPADSTHVLIPVKDFTRAKARLAPALGPSERAELARDMATRVVRALQGRPVWIVCDDADVAAWAASVGASIAWQPGLGLNGAVAAATRRRFAQGARRVTVVHSDLPLLVTLPEASENGDAVILVPDRHGRGTNVVSTPSAEFRFAYGATSLRRHIAEAARLGLPAQVVRDGHLEWDVDEPADLTVFDTLDRATGRTLPVDDDGRRMETRAGRRSSIVRAPRHARCDDDPPAATSCR